MHPRSTAAQNGKTPNPTTKMRLLPLLALAYLHSSAGASPSLLIVSTDCSEHPDLSTGGVNLEEDEYDAHTYVFEMAGLLAIGLDGGVGVVDAAREVLSGKAPLLSWSTPLSLARPLSYLLTDVELVLVASDTGVVVNSSGLRMVVADSAEGAAKALRPSQGASSNSAPPFWATYIEPTLTSALGYFVDPFGVLKLTFTAFHTHVFAPLSTLLGKLSAAVAAALSKGGKGGGFPTQPSSSTSPHFHLTPFLGRVFVGVRLPSHPSSSSSSSSTTPAVTMHCTLNRVAPRRVGLLSVGLTLGAWSDELAGSPTFLYSAGGIAALALSFVAITYILWRSRKRVLGERGGGVTALAGGVVAFLAAFFPRIRGSGGWWVGGEGGGSGGHTWEHFFMDTLLPYNHPLRDYIPLVFQYWEVGVVGAVFLGAAGIMWWCAGGRGSGEAGGAGAIGTPLVGGGSGGGGGYSNPLTRPYVKAALLSCAGVCIHAAIAWAPAGYACMAALALWKLGVVGLALGVFEGCVKALEWVVRACVWGVCLPEVVLGVVTCGVMDVWFLREVSRVCTGYTGTLWGTNAGGGSGGSGGYGKSNRGPFVPYGAVPATESPGFRPLPGHPGGYGGGEAAAGFAPTPSAPPANSSYLNHHQQQQQSSQHHHHHQQQQQHLNHHSAAPPSSLYQSVGHSTAPPPPPTISSPYFQSQQQHFQATHQQQHFQQQHHHQQLHHPYGGHTGGSFLYGGGGGGGGMSSSSSLVDDQERARLAAQRAGELLKGGVGGVGAGGSSRGRAGSVGRGGVGVGSRVGGGGGGGGGGVGFGGVHLMQHQEDHPGNTGGGVSTTTATTAVLPQQGFWGGWWGGGSGGAGSAPPPPPPPAPRGGVVTLTSSPHMPSSMTKGNGGGGGLGGARKRAGSRGPSPKVQALMSALSAAIVEDEQYAGGGEEEEEEEGEEE